MRHLFALLMLMTVPLVVGIWVIIHPFIAFWRRLGPAPTYMITFPALGGLVFGMYAMRHQLLNGNLGLSYILVVLGFVLMALETRLFLHVKKQLPWLTMLGLPEIDPKAHATKLITGGIYSRIRHPRYAQILLMFLSWSLIANYLSIYVLFILSVPALCLIAWLEERELVDRFGGEYLEYRKLVPMFIPKLWEGRR